MGWIETKKKIIDFFQRERGKLLGYIRRKALDLSQMDAEDIVSDVLLNIFNKADFVAHIENLTAYIYRSIANKIVDYRRKNRSTISLEQSENITDFTHNIDRVLQQRDLAERLYDAINKLEPKQRAVWIATEIQGRNFKELAAMWNEPIGTLLSRKSRATKALQASLKDFLEI